MTNSSAFSLAGEGPASDRISEAGLPSGLQRNRRGSAAGWVVGILALLVVAGLGRRVTHGELR